MRNNILIKTLFIFFSLGALASCAKELEIEPVNSVDESKALNTSGDVIAALVGTYADLGNVNLYGGRAFVMSELLADFNELNWSGTFQGLTQIYNKQIPVDNLFGTNTWLASYRVINDVNNILSRLDLVVAASKNRVEGEAKFIRACTYFELVRLYAKSWNNGDPAQNDGVPLVLTPTKAPLTDADNKPRAKVAAVYQQIIQDLTDAETKLPASNGFFANKYAAAGMLSRVYLQKADYANAAAAANRVISSNQFGLMATYAEAFPYNNAQPVSNTDEDVFAIQVNKTSGTNDFQNFFSADGRGEIDITDDHLNLYESTDDRLNLFYSSGGSTYTGKHDNLYGNVHIIRLAEMYLTRAEANIRLGTSVGATPKTDLNTIRNRVGLSSLATVTLSNILNERRLELAFEGSKLQDVKRTQGSIGSLQWNSPKLVFPIPDRERKVNTNLTQNEGY